MRLVLVSQDMSLSVNDVYKLKFRSKLNFWNNRWGSLLNVYILVVGQSAVEDVNQSVICSWNFGL